MATVKMVKGDKYADIFDSPETIKQAQCEGYSLVEKTTEKTIEKAEKVVEKKVEEKKVEETPAPKRKSSRQ